jgi:hypothetical protein
MTCSWKIAMSLGLALAAACSGEPPREPLGADPAEAPAVEEESQLARAELRSLRAQFVHASPLRAPLDADDAEAPRPLAQPALPARTGPEHDPLPELIRDGGALRVRAARPTRVAIELGGIAADGFRLEDVETGVAMRVTLRGAGAAPAEVAEGHVVYRGGGPGGGAWVHAVSASATEDYLALPAAPPGDEVIYDLEIAEGVAGLRLVSNTLELLDARGAPRLRVAPPYLVGADGARVPATLAVAGCDIDRAPLGPWGRPTTPPGAERCALHVQWRGERVAYPALLDPSWSSTANLSVPRAFHVSAALPTRVLVAGGWNGTTAHATAELYDAVTRTWAATGSMSTARMAATATRLNDGRVLVAAGMNTVDVATAEIYNPTTGTFTAAGTMTGARHFHAATLLTTGAVLVAGGTLGASTQLATAQLYNPATNTWSATGSLLSVQGIPAAVRLASGQVLVTGLAAPSAQLYNPATGTFTATGALAVPRRLHTATLLPSGDVLVVGGRDSTSAVSSLLSAEIYRPSTGTFTRTGATPTGHDTHTATLIDGRVVVLGDRSAGALAQAFDPAWGTWSPWPSAITGRYAHIAEPVGTSKVLMAGGTLPGTPTVTAASEELKTLTTPVAVSEYKLPAAIDPDVIAGRSTELWAAVYRPATLAPGTRYPLVVLLHGNHGTCGTGSSPRVDNNCQYTTMGTCPAGYTVVPNHLGYAYAATELASRDFIVVSINANLGITCGAGVTGDSGLNLARGRLVLKHLQQLSEWNRGVTATPASLGVSLAGALDLTRVGLMGHSRGGEGQRAAYQQYRDAGSPWPARIVDPVTFRGIFEIGPVDGQTSRVLNADGTKWAVLLPMCDGDVSNLQGVKPFDRAMALTSESTVSFKSTYTVFGANHNYYNTEWQQSDSSGCTGHRAMFSSGSGITGSAEQRQTGFYSMVAFFASSVGPTATLVFNALFDPWFSLRSEPRIDRGYSPGIGTTVNRPLEDFINPTGTSTFGQPNAASGITISHGTIPEHDAGFRGATISWTAAGAGTYFQSNWAPVGSGFDLTPYTALDLRIDRARDTTLNPAAATTFTVSLVTSADVLSAPQPVTAVVLDGPVGGPFGYHAMLQTLRIPLSQFAASVSLSAIRGARLTFSSTATGKIYVASVRATRLTTSGGPLLAPRAPLIAPQAVVAAAEPARAPQEITAGNRVVSVRAADVSGSEWVEIELASAAPFLARGELPVLQVGDATTDLSEHPGGDLRRIVFRLSRRAFDQAAAGAPLAVRYGAGGDAIWRFGALDKTRLAR